MPMSEEGESGERIEKESLLPANSIYHRGRGKDRGREGVSSTSQRGEEMERSGRAVEGISSMVQGKEGNALG